MGEKIDTTQIQLNVGNKPHIVLLKEYGLECYSLSLMNPHYEFGDLKLWSSLSLFSWSLPAGRPFFFFCSIAPCLLSLKDVGEIYGT